MEDDPRERLPEAIGQKIAWVREGAGDRFDRIELSLIPTIIVTNDRQSCTERLIRERGWRGITPEQVWTMPSVAIGSEGEIVETLEWRREEYGFSYYVFADALAEACAPVVARLSGR